MRATTVRWTDGAALGMTGCCDAMGCCCARTGRCVSGMARPLEWPEKNNGVGCAVAHCADRTGCSDVSHLASHCKVVAKAPRGPAATRRTASVAKVPTKRAGMRETASSAARACSRGPGSRLSGSPAGRETCVAAPLLPLCRDGSWSWGWSWRARFPAFAGVDPGVSRGERAEMWFLRWLLERVAVGLLCAFSPTGHDHRLFCLLLLLLLLSTPVSDRLPSVLRQAAAEDDDESPSQSTVAWTTASSPSSTSCFDGERACAWRLRNDSHPPTPPPPSPPSPSRAIHPLLLKRSLP